MNVDRPELTARFSEYVAGYDADDPKIAMKRTRSLRVAASSWLRATSTRCPTVDSTTPRRETVCASVALGYADTAGGAPNREPQNITGNPVAFVD